MSFLDSFFGKSSERASNINWSTLSDIAQLDTIVKDSDNKTQVIFKHSTRCGISSSVLRKFEQQFDHDNSSLSLHFLDLLNYRSISNEIAERFDITHQSPQLLVIKNGVVVAHDSHYTILDIDMTTC